jgi:hypothetical protein
LWRSQSTSAAGCVSSAVCKCTGLNHDTCTDWYCVQLCERCTPVAVATLNLEQFDATDAYTQQCTPAAAGAAAAAVNASRFTGVTALPSGGRDTLGAVLLYGTCQA